MVHIYLIFCCTEEDKHVGSDFPGFSLLLPSVLIRKGEHILEPESNSAHFPPNLNTDLQCQCCTELKID